MYDVVIVERFDKSYWLAQVVEVHQRCESRTWGIKFIRDGTPLSDVGVYQVGIVAMQPYNAITTAELTRKVANSDNENGDRTNQLLTAIQRADELCKFHNKREYFLYKINALF